MLGALPWGGAGCPVPKMRWTQSMVGVRGGLRALWAVCRPGLRAGLCNTAAQQRAARWRSMVVEAGGAQRHSGSRGVGRGGGPRAWGGGVHRRSRGRWGVG